MVDPGYLEGGCAALSASVSHSGSAVVVAAQCHHVGNAVDRRCGRKGHTDGGDLDGRSRRVRHQLAEGGRCSRGIGRLVHEGGEGVHRGGALHPRLQGGPRKLLRATVRSYGVLAERSRYRASAAVTASGATATRCLSALEKKISGSTARVQPSFGAQF